MLQVVTPNKPLIFPNRTEIGVARHLLESQGLRTGSGGPGTFFSGADFYLFRDGKWTLLTTREMIREVLRLTETALVTVRSKVKTDDGEVRWKEKEVPLEPSFKFVEGVVACMQALCEHPIDDMPFFLGSQGIGDIPNKDEVFTFEDALVWLDGGEWRSVPRPDSWVSKFVIPVKWDGVKGGEGEAPPVWGRCLGEWGQGDPEWSRLLRQWMGYMMLPSTRFEKFMLLYKATRGGKGTIGRVQEKILGDSMQGVDMQSLSGDFGAASVRKACFVNVAELEKGGTLTSSRLSRFMKMVLGRDMMTVNVKYQEATKMRLKAKIQLMGNEMPGLENVGSSISSKMLILPFQVSFEGRQDFRLDEKLQGELGGIVRWAMEGWKDLVEGERDPSTMWARPALHEEIMDDFKKRSTPYTAFLKAYFQPSAGGWVSMDQVKSRFNQFCKECEIPKPCGLNVLGSKLVEEGGWALKRERSRSGGEKGMWGLRGMALKKVSNVED